MNELFKARKRTCSYLLFAPAAGYLLTNQITAITCLDRPTTVKSTYTYYTQLSALIATNTVNIEIEVLTSLQNTNRLLF
jgi:hypothetical protein